MIRGFYTAVSGVVSSMTQEAVVADSIANSNAVGFGFDAVRGHRQSGRPAARSTRTARRANRERQVRVRARSGRK